jgi:hypothetical protein
MILAGDPRGVLQHSCRMQTSSWLHQFCHQQPDHQGLGFQDSTWKTYKNYGKSPFLMGQLTINGHFQ